MVHDQKRARVAEVSLRSEARAKREKRRRPASLMVNAGTARRRGTRRRIAERSMQAGATRAASQRVSVHSQRQARHSQVVPMYCSQTPHPAKPWFINTIMPAQKTLMVASLDGAEYALLDSGSGLTSCRINYADDLPLLPRPTNLPILSNATGGSVECIGQRQVGYRLENGEPFVVTWHVANVTNLIISTESLMAANIEVRNARNESSMIMDRCGTRSSVVLHKFAKVPWLKLYRDNSVLDSDLRIAAINTNAMAIDEIDSDEERRSRLRRKKETLEMDDNLEIQGTLDTEGSDARGSRDPVPLPLETSTAQRSAPD